MKRIQVAHTVCVGIGRVSFLLQGKSLRKGKEFVVTL